MKKIPVVFAVLACMGALHAAPVCKAPKEKWLPEPTIKMALWKQGFQIKSFSVQNGCYAVAGLDKSGNRFEIYLDPATGETIEE